MAERRSLPHSGQAETPRTPVVLPPLSKPPGLGRGDADYDKRLSAYIEVADVADIHLTDVSSHKNGRTGRPKKKSSRARNRRECYFDDHDDSPDLRSAIPSRGLHKLQAAEAPKAIAKMKNTDSKKQSAKTKMYAPMTAEQESARKDRSHRIDRKDHAKNKAVRGTSERLPQMQILKDNEEMLGEQPHNITQRRKQLITMKFRGYNTMGVIEEEMREKRTCNPKKKGLAKRKAEVAIKNATIDATAKDQSYCTQRQEGRSSSDVPCSGLLKKPDALLPRRRKRNSPKVWVYSKDGPDDGQRQEMRIEKAGTRSTKPRKQGSVQKRSFGPAVLVAHWKEKQRAAESGKSVLGGKKPGCSDDDIMLELKLHERFMLQKLKRGGD